MIRSSLRAALAAVLLAFGAGVGAGETASQPAPGLAQVPQGDRSGLALSTLDSTTAYDLSQAAIGKQIGDHVLLDRQGRPTRLADYRGKPLLVNFIYTACFHVCPTTTRNLQTGDEGVLDATRNPSAELGIPQPGARHRRRPGGKFRLQLCRHHRRVRPP
ncbi:MAG: SCO family protein [Rhodocyclales bacterium]|nr:SCO family protein [Rhodocyclales bacterium]